MPYQLIKGTFHLAGRNQAGNPTSFQPDGDSIHFRPNNPARLDDLEQVFRPYRLTHINSTNLRFEGIDATEMHYGGSRQPYPQAEDARDYVTGAFGMNPVRYRADGVRVLPPANDGQQGYILSKQLDFHGRPIAFVFVGDHSARDGSWLHVDSQMVRGSVNYRLLNQGLVYPLFYDTLFNDLRETMRAAAIRAAEAWQELWEYDWTNDWVGVRTQTGIEQDYNIFPKLFRRVTDFHNEHNGFSEQTFVSWLDQRSENDEVWVRPEWNRTHFDNVVEVSNGRIRMTRFPEDLVFVSRR